ncbi:MAG: F0F1 ATP synthase subunit A [Coriobacteriales bacterium]|nr:F0F1 ATP synthase subunit A [Coriobacteriales bacterium]
MSDVEGAAVDTGGIIVVVNSALVGAALVATGWWLAHKPLSASDPSPRQNAGEAILDFFVGKARGVSRGPKYERLMGTVTPFLATLFLFIFVSNLFAILPLPVINRPPTSHFSVTLTLAIIAVSGTILIGALAHGPLKAAKHLVWPNPLQWISEITDVLSLSLRLFGNIAGEYMTLLLVVAVVPFGIPLILHVLGLIPVFVQAFVFTLLTASFLAAAVGEQEAESAETTAESAETSPEASTESASRDSEIRPRFSHRGEGVQS